LSYTREMMVFIRSFQPVSIPDIKNLHIFKFMIYSPSLQTYILNIFAKEKT